MSSHGSRIRRNWQGSDGIPTRLGRAGPRSRSSRWLIGAVDRAAGRHRSRPLRPLRQPRDQHLQRRARGAVVRHPGHRLPGASGSATLPIVLALTALAIPPMVTNSYVALREVDPDIKEAARGMGYRELAQLAARRVTAGGTADHGRRPHLGGPGGGHRDPRRAHRRRRTSAATSSTGWRATTTRELVAGALLVAAPRAGHRAARWPGCERLLVPRGIRLLKAPTARRAHQFKTAKCDLRWKNQGELRVRSQEASPGLRRGNR